MSDSTIYTIGVVIASCVAIVICIYKYKDLLDSVRSGYDFAALWFVMFFAVALYAAAWPLSLPLSVLAGLLYVVYPPTRQQWLMNRPTAKSGDWDRLLPIAYSCVSVTSDGALVFVDRGYRPEEFTFVAKCRIKSKASIRVKVVTLPYSPINVIPPYHHAVYLTRRSRVYVVGSNNDRKAHKVILRARGVKPADLYLEELR